MAKNDQNQMDDVNPGVDRPVGLRMDRERTQRFSRMLSRMARAIHSLEAAGVQLEDVDVSSGRMDPGATLRAFSSVDCCSFNMAYSRNEPPPCQRFTTSDLKSRWPTRSPKGKQSSRVNAQFGTMRQDINLVFQMLNNEENPEVGHGT